MIQSALDQAVAAATGEPIRRIARLGFSLADPLVVQFDPEPDRGGQAIDWDAREDERLGLFPDRQRRAK